MLLAIDVGNTQTSFGLWDGAAWRAVWRRQTAEGATEDELAAWLAALFRLSELPFEVAGIAYASVVPACDEAFFALGRRWFHQEVVQLNAGADVGLRVLYDPPGAVGADRLANALGALARFAPPLVVVDFGTATTFDSVDASGAYVGGAILPGPLVAAQALVARAAKLPQVALVAPPSALGRNTVHSLQSGLVLGYAAAITGLASAIAEELGPGAAVIATGGLAPLYVGLCPLISSYEPTLTLEGLLVARERLR